MPRKKRAKPAVRTAEEQREWDILFPIHEVELRSGQKVNVRQWDIDLGALLSARVVKLIQKLQGKMGEVELEELMLIAKDECFDIVCETIGWTRQQLRKQATFEDFMDLLQAVIDTSLIRQDGSGVLPKVVSLAAALVPLVGVKPSPSRPPSTSSSEPATPSPNSGE
jgi:hypothetical protein